jgi:hypothetical protein
MRKQERGMKKLEIDFVRRTRTPWVARALLALALAMTADTALSFFHARASLARNQAQLARAEPRGAAPRKLAPEELAAVRATVERLATPWDRLFGALEAASNDQVALLGIEPDAKAGTVLITGDSKSYLAALSYVLNLSRVEGLSGVQLVRHEAKANDPRGAVSFAVSAAWNGAQR